MPGIGPPTIRPTKREYRTETQLRTVMTQVAVGPPEDSNLRTRLRRPVKPFGSAV
jgi:hypothetical protein